MSDTQLNRAGIEIYHTGAQNVGGWQSAVASCLGGNLSSTPAGGLTVLREPPHCFGLRIVGCSASIGEGYGVLRVTGASTFDWMPPGETTWSPTCTIADGEQQTAAWLDGSSHYTKWIRVERSRSADLSEGNEETLQFVNTQCTAAVGRPFITAAAGTSYTYTGLIVKNNGTESADVQISLGTLAYANLIDLGYEATVGDTIQTIANETTAPTAISFDDYWHYTLGSPAAVTLAPGGTAGLWIRRTYSFLNVSDNYPAYITVEYSCDGETNLRSDICGIAMKGNPDYERYELYCSASLPIDYTAAAQTTAATVGALTYSPGDGTWYVQVLHRNQFYIRTQPRSEQTIVISSGAQVANPPAAPTDISAYPKEHGKVLVTAIYSPVTEGPTIAEIAAQRANAWLVYKGIQGTGPETGTPEVIQMGAADPADNVDLGIDMVPLYYPSEEGYDASNTGYMDGAPASILVRTRRTVGEVDYDSTNTTTADITTQWWPEQIRRPDVSYGRVRAQRPVWTEPGETIYIDEAKDLKWIVTGEGTQLWWESELIWNIRPTGVYSTYTESSPADPYFGNLAWELLEDWDGDTLKECITVAAWTDETKTLYIHGFRQGADGVYRTTTGVGSIVLRGAPTEIGGEDVDYSKSLIWDLSCGGTATSNAPTPSWGAHNRTFFQYYDGASGLWKTAFSVDVDNSEAVAFEYLVPIIGCATQEDCFK